MSHPETMPAPMPASGTQTIEEPALNIPAKSCAVGGGIIGSVCCGHGLVSLVATVAGATGVMAFVGSWGAMQGLTLISFAFTVSVVLLLALAVTRRARAGLAPAERRRVYGRSTARLGGWMLGGYFFMFVVVNAIAGLAGFKY